MQAQAGCRLRTRTRGARRPLPPPPPFPPGHRPPPPRPLAHPCPSSKLLWTRIYRPARSPRQIAWGGSGSGISEGRSSHSRGPGGRRRRFAAARRSEPAERTRRTGDPCSAGALTWTCSIRASEPWTPTAAAAAQQGRNGGRSGEARAARIWARFWARRRCRGDTQARRPPPGHWQGTGAPAPGRRRRVAADAAPCESGL